MAVDAASSSLPSITDTSARNAEESCWWRAAVASSYLRHKIALGHNVTTHTPLSHSHVRSLQSHVRVSAVLQPRVSPVNTTVANFLSCCSNPGPKQQFQPGLQGPVSHLPSVATICHETQGGKRSRSRPRSTRRSWLRRCCHASTATRASKPDIMERRCSLTMQLGLAWDANQRRACPSRVGSTRSAAHESVCARTQNRTSHGLTLLLCTTRPRAQKLHRGHPQTPTCRPCHPGGALLGRSPRRPSLFAKRKCRSVHARASTHATPNRSRSGCCPRRILRLRASLCIEWHPRQNRDRHSAVLTNRGPCTRRHTTSLGDRRTRLHPGQHKRESMKSRDAKMKRTVEVGHGAGSHAGCCMRTNWNWPGESSK